MSYDLREDYVLLKLRFICRLSTCGAFTLQSKSLTYALGGNVSCRYAVLTPDLRTKEQKECPQLLIRTAAVMKSLHIGHRKDESSLERCPFESPKSLGSLSSA